MTASEMLSCTFIAQKARARVELSKRCKKIFQNKGSLETREVWEVQAVSL